MKNYVRVPVQRGWKTIKDLYEDIQPIGGYVCGGYARWMCAPIRPVPATPGDVDIYCLNEACFRNIKALFTYRRMKPSTKTKWAITYHNHGYPRLPLSIQLIRPAPYDTYITDPLNRFDFSICRAAVLDESEGIADWQFLKHEGDKHLAIRSFTPELAVMRVAKYMQKGYSMGSMDLLRVFACNEIDAFSPCEMEKLVKYIGNNNIEKGMFVDEFKDIYTRWMQRKWPQNVKTLHQKLK